jgi:hypothetical protein
MLIRTAAPMMKQISRNSEALQRVTNIFPLGSIVQVGGHRDGIGEVTPSLSAPALNRPRRFDDGFSL